MTTIIVKISKIGIKIIKNRHAKSIPIYEKQQLSNKLELLFLFVIFNSF